jgi:acyl-CoA synthetase (AMP-forming)/AMP-acid ligase II
VSFSAVPAGLAALLRAPGAEEANRSSPRCVICGVAPLTRHLLEAFERRFGHHDDHPSMRIALDLHGTTAALHLLGCEEA